MLDLITLLIFNLNTIDGVRDSATKLKHMLIENRTYGGKLNIE
jgi:hypothetical protein